MLALLAATAQAEVRMANVFGEHMVLQHGRVQTKTVHFDGEPVELRFTP